MQSAHPPPFPTPPPPPLWSPPPSSAQASSSQPPDLMKAIREVDKKALKPAQTRDTKKSKDTKKATRGGDLMPSLKLALERRRSGLSRNIPFETQEEVEDDSEDSGGSGFLSSSRRKRGNF